MKITSMWPELPKDLTRVDAVYERPDRKIAFFVGKQSKYRLRTFYVANLTQFLILFLLFQARNYTYSNQDIWYQDIQNHLLTLVYQTV